MEERHTTDRFLKKYGIHRESIDIEEICRHFLEEMERGLEGRESSLKMIPTYITPRTDIPVEEPVLVIDAGGTNFRVAVLHFDRDGKPVTKDFKLYAMPGTGGAINAKRFFDTIAGYLEPFLGRSRKIGFCFSYPTEILPNRDGRLVRFCKEVQVEGVEGTLVGQGLLNTLKARGYSGEMKIVLLNDTVATLLGGMAVYPTRNFDSYIGFILGTGTNTCYMENIGDLGKLKGLAGEQGTMLVNMEAGAFGKAPRGEIDLEFDAGTINPGEYVFEKMISGGYQGGLFLALVRKAASEGLLGEKFRTRVERITRLESREMDEFLLHPYSDTNTLARCCAAGQEGDTDRQVLYFLMDEMAERAAKLVAANLAAVMRKTGKGKNPCKPVCITAEGSTFYKSRLFRGKLDFYIKTYLNEQLGFYCELVKGENTTLVGTAIAGLMD